MDEKSAKSRKLSKKKSSKGMKYINITKTKYHL